MTQSFTRLKTKLAKKPKTESSRRWLLRQLNDPFVEKAKKEGYRSRAAFKILEINEKYGLINPSSVVVDLGSTPGGWSQVASKLVKFGKGQVIALDINPMEPLPDVEFILGDFTQDETLQKLIEIAPNQVDVVISDMAAPACGVPAVDHDRIMYLLELALEFAHSHLKTGGHFVAKVLKGGTEGKLLLNLKKSFSKVHHFKPKSSRSDSAESYVVALGYKKA